jgi:hypothetical protein
MSSFGSRDSFAIEADFIGKEGKWCFGHLCFVVAGRVIGDFADSADLASSARWGRTFLSASARRARAAPSSPGTAPLHIGQ